MKMGKNRIQMGNFVIRRIPSGKTAHGIPEIRVSTVSLNWDMTVRSGAAMYALLDELISFAGTEQVNPPLESFVSAMLANMYAVCSIAPDAVLMTDVTRALDAWASRHAVTHTEAEDAKALEETRQTHGQ